MIDYFSRKSSLFTNNGQIIYQASQYVIRPSPILKTLFGSRRRLETYNSLFALDGKEETGGQHLGLYVVSKFPDIFLNKLPGLLPNREIEFYINMVLGAQFVSITAYRMAFAELTELRK